MRASSGSSGPSDWSTPTYTRLVAFREQGAELEELAELAVASLGEIPNAVPIERLALLCGARGIVAADLENSSGMLILPDGREGPIIVVHTGNRRRRRRFTVAHELAHILLGHMYLGRLTDDAEERQANRLAALLLLPPGRVRSVIGGHGPDVRGIERVADEFEVSVDAAARAYVAHQPEPTAAVILRRGVIERSYQDHGLPYVEPRVYDPVPSGSGANDTSLDVGGCRSADLRDNGVWFNPSKARSVAFVEQVYKRSAVSTLVVLHKRIDASTTAKR